MVVFEGHLVTRPKVMHIPLDIILQTAKLVQNFDSENVLCHECVVLLCGLFCIPGSAKKTITLPWSPLMSKDTNSLPHEDLLRLAKHWVIDRFSEMFAVFDTTVTDLWKRESHGRCIQFLLRGEQNQSWPVTSTILTAMY